MPDSQPPVILGVDVGGTFTDFLLYRDGRLEVHKRPSTPDDPVRAILEGLDALDARPDLLVHGSTVATNAVIERRGARTALVTTEGFRDLLRIGRQTRQELYDLEPITPEPLVPEELCFELHGRLRPDGSVEVAPDHSEVRNLVRQAEEAGAEAFAVSLLYAYSNPTLEELFDPATASTDLFLSLSSRVSPEYREVERTATTALNAYVGPVMSRYLERLELALAQREASEWGAAALASSSRGSSIEPLPPTATTLRVVQSDGGAADVRRAATLPVATLLSGPAAGVAGAFALAQRAGFERVLTFDMGGTSTDVALCDAAIPHRSDIVVAGLAARTAAVDVHTVGAGGGSIARIDAGGALRVGPQSAGAEPGPAAYGRGIEFTVTDAQVILGRLGKEGLLGGAMQLDERRARRAASSLVHAFGGDPHAAAQAVVDVATANMERALRVVSVQRGYDPRDFTLVAFGGAGPLHACALATALDIPRVLVPTFPGVLAALGAATSDLTATQTQSVLRPLDDLLLATLRDAFDAVSAHAREHVGRRDVEVAEALDLRYAGQSYELTVPVARPIEIDAIRSAFDALHEARFAHHDSAASVEVVNVRATARIAAARIANFFPSPPEGEVFLPSGRTGEASPTLTHEQSPGAQEPETERPVWFDGQRLPAQVVSRTALTPGRRLIGPALVTQLDATTLVAPGWIAVVDAGHNLILEHA